MIIAQDDRHKNNALNSEKTICPRRTKTIPHYGVNAIQYGQWIFDLDVLISHVPLN